MLPHLEVVYLLRYFAYFYEFRECVNQKNFQRNNVDGGYSSAVVDRYILGIKKFLPHWLPYNIFLSLTTP